MAVTSIKKLDTPKAKSLGRVGLKAFFKLSQSWGLTQADQLTLLGLSSRTTLNNWKSKAQANEGIKLGVDTLERLSLILGIQKGIELLFPESYRVEYMRAPNRYFNGSSILDVMLEGRITALYKARRYLEASRGAHFC